MLAPLEPACGLQNARSHPRPAKWLSPRMGPQAIGGWTGSTRHEDGDGQRSLMSDFGCSFLASFRGKRANEPATSDCALGQAASFSTNTFWRGGSWLKWRRLRAHFIWFVHPSCAAPSDWPVAAQESSSASRANPWLSRRLLLISHTNGDSCCRFPPPQATQATQRQPEL
ncbi:uncharacterized protein BJX67DRAFT_157904 [Aspergillus lucknowensis]|uniref:Uncharacterized protein n=1 Tax=Aspergillus lucknowensis TaxID=176173 RepID=A0ABR4M3X0_9EURO